MSLPLFPHCFRGRDDCEPIDCIDASPEGLTEEQYMTFDYTPHSFVCSGCVKREAREDLPQDAYRICFKNAVVDDMSDNDEQDLTHVLRVVSTALALIATRRVNGGPSEQIVARQGGAMDVPTGRGLGGPPISSS